MSTFEERVEIVRAALAPALPGGHLPRLSDVHDPITRLADRVVHALEDVRASDERELRERLAAAIKVEEPAIFGSPDDPYQRGWSQMRGKAARIVRERP